MSTLAAFIHSAHGNHKIPSELHTFYELFGHASTAQGHRDIQVLSNEQVTKPSSQDIFGYRHLVVENAPFQTYPFNSFGLGRLFGSHSALLFIGAYFSQSNDTLLSHQYRSYARNRENCKRDHTPSARQRQSTQWQHHQYAASIHDTL